MQWWGMMQPSWWLFQGLDGPLDLVQETPKAETWQGLKKGGMAGIYIVVMGLSWWVKVQQNKPDPNAWAAVNDLSWVVQQMSNTPDTLTLKKRRCEPESEGKEDNEQSEHKRQYVDGIWPYWTLMSSLAIIDPIHYSSSHGSIGSFDIVIS